MQIICNGWHLCTVPIEAFGCCSPELLMLSIQMVQSWSSTATSFSLSTFAQENSEFCTNSENLSSLAVLEWLSGRQGCTWKRYINILTLLHSSFAPSMLRVSSQHPCALVNLVYIVCSSFCFICAKYPSYKLQKNNHRN